MVCPDCKKPMRKMTVRIKESWAILRLCNCRPSFNQSVRLEKTYQEIISKNSLVKEAP